MSDRYPERFDGNGFSNQNSIKRFLFLSGTGKEAKFMYSSYRYMSDRVFSVMVVSIS